MPLIHDRRARAASFLCLAILMLAPSTLGLSFGKSDETITVPKSEKPPVMDGVWTTRTEWTDASETKIVDEELMAVLRAKHDGQFAYLLFDFISDQGLERSGDLAVICLDTAANGGNTPLTDDYCFYRITKAGNFLEGIMQGNGMGWTVLQEARGYDPYGTKNSFKAKMGYARLNDPYDSSNNHVSYEFRIPIDSYGLEEIMRLYVYANDGFSNNFVEWPADAGGKQFKATAKGVLPAPNEWGNMHLEIEKMIEPPEPAVKLEEKVEVRVQAKQIKDLVIVRVRNMDDSTADIHAFKILVTDSLLKTFKGPKEWSKEGLNDNGAVFFTPAKPVRAGDKEYFLLKVEGVKPLIQWTVYGSDENELAEGAVTPFVR